MKINDPISGNIIEALLKLIGAKGYAYEAQHEWVRNPPTRDHRPYELLESVIPTPPAYLFGRQDHWARRS